MQEIKRIDTNKNLPVLLLGTSLELLNIIKDNTQSVLQTDEQKIDKYINERAGYLEDSSKEAAKKTILERYKKHKAETDEEKERIMQKTVNTYYDLERRKKQRMLIRVSERQEINTYITDHIR